MQMAQETGYHYMVALICSENTASIKLADDCQCDVVECPLKVGHKFGRWLDVT